ncbi:MAG: dTDP-4-dehydrorhamnose 3,5-epimerase [Solirubrobacteraceae bacterium]|nr:dTDP-4-dehydrorhamnose 3,5-epimerase [Solirubrobacteraceae bacterium]
MPDDDGAPIRERQTVTPAGEPIAELVDGMTIREIVTQTDERGTLFELFDPRWDWHPQPLVYAYATTIRPGVTKGWARHSRHDDRYALMFGEMELVCFDDREGSPTRGLVSTIVLSEHRRRLVCIPTGVWHADRNIGSRDVVLVNFPTAPYEHADPDKERLPLDTPLIPHTFDEPRGW